MSKTHSELATSVDEIADGIFRISTPTAFPDGSGFTYNQYLIIDDEPLLFHTGPRKLFPQVREAVARLMPVARLRHVGFSHVESDEFGSLNDWLEAAPEARPLCGLVAALTSINDLAIREPRVAGEGEVISLGSHQVRWLATPHLPHGWECGYLFEEQTRTLLCGDLFTQGGTGMPAVTEEDILGPSEGFRKQMDYYAHGRDQAALLEKLAATGPTTLACMHGSAWRGDGASLLRALAQALEAPD